MAKRELWEQLNYIINNIGDNCLCLCGDFNAVRHEEECKGKGIILDRQMLTCLIILLLMVL